MKTLTTTFVLAAALSAVHAQADDYILSYDSTNGSLTIKAPGELSVYGIRAADDIFDTSKFNPFIPDPFQVEIKANKLAETSFSSSVDAGEYLLGVGLLPTGMDLAAFQGVISQAEYIPGTGGVDGSLTLEVVPEPASLALIGLGGLLVGRRRR